MCENSSTKPYHVQDSWFFANWIYIWKDFIIVSLIKLKEIVNCTIKSS